LSPSIRPQRRELRHTAEINRFLVDIGNGTKACDTTGPPPGTATPEAATNLDVAQRLAALAHGLGARVVLTRSDNNGWGPVINEGAIGTAAHADVGDFRSTPTARPPAADSTIYRRSWLA